MTLEILRATLAWCTVINSAFLIAWALIFWLGRDWIYRMHGRVFEMSKERFNAIHYAGLTYFKMTIIIFNLVPYLALRIVA